MCPRRAVRSRSDHGLRKGSNTMETLGKYGFLEKLRDDPFGTVYKAYDGSVNRHVAIRTIGPEIKWDPVLRERFSAECRALLGLSHPNIAALYEFGENGNAYVVVELLPGKDLKTLIEEKAPVTVERKLSIMTQAAAGMGYAHDHGVLHRSLRPGNIQLLPDGTVKVADLSLTGILRHTPVLPEFSGNPVSIWRPNRCRGRQPADSQTYSPSELSSTSF